MQQDSVATAAHRRLRSYANALSVGRVDLMLIVTRTESAIDVRVETRRRPLVYLDQCAIYDLAKASLFGERFAQLFRHRGELLLSSINLFELGQLQGASLQRVKAFLDDVVGLSWIPIEFDAAVVIERELSSRFDPSPAISESLLEMATATPGVPTLSKLLENAKHSEEQARELLAAKNELGRQIEALRDDYRRDPSILARRYPNIPVTPQTKTLSVAADVFRLAVEHARGGNHFRWSANDAEDFTHAITGLTHADVVVLDGKWAARVQGLNRAAVFSCGDLGPFLDWCEAI